MLRNMFIVLFLIFETPVTGVTEMGKLWFLLILLLLVTCKNDWNKKKSPCTFLLMQNALLFDKLYSGRRERVTFRPWLLKGPKLCFRPRCPPWCQSRAKLWPVHRVKLYTRLQFKCRQLQHLRQSYGRLRHCNKCIATFHCDCVLKVSLLHGFCFTAIFTFLGNSPYGRLGPWFPRLEVKVNPVAVLLCQPAWAP